MNSANVGVVAIGRNEGERLKRCLGSVPAGAASVYVDSGSTDGSAQWARDHGADVVELDMSVPFTAARARNAGFQTIEGIRSRCFAMCSSWTAIANWKQSGSNARSPF